MTGNYCDWDVRIGVGECKVHQQKVIKQRTGVQYDEDYWSIFAVVNVHVGGLLKISVGGEARKITEGELMPIHEMVASLGEFKHPRQSWVWFMS